MKKRLFYLFALICSVSLFTACSDDDNEGPSGNPITEAIDSQIVGNYNGKLTVLMGQPMDFHQKVAVTKAGETSIDLLIKDFSFPGMGSLGDINLKNCELTQNGDKYVCTREEDITLKDPIGTCPTKTSISFADGKLDVALHITWQGVNIDVTYGGKRLTGSESSEAKITSFKFDSPAVTTQPVIDGNNITFSVDKSATSEQLSVLIPTITLSSDKAVVSPASGVAQDFSNGKKVKYTVVAEDGTAVIYTVYISGQNTVTVYDFEEWEEVTSSVFSDHKYELPVGGPWGSTNDGVASIKGMLSSAAPEWANSLEYAVAPSSDAQNGSKSVVIKTIDTILPGETSVLQDVFGIPRNTAGSLFLGTFKTEMSDKLASTKFGIPFNETSKPLSFSGWYKYTAGKINRDTAGNPLDKKDECDIYALLYEAEDEEGKEVTLIGGSTKEENQKYCITTSPYVVLKAQITDKSDKAEWTYFNLPFEEMNGKTFDPSKKYKITFVCTPSIEGANYIGAPGSVLQIDDFKITLAN